MISVSGHRFHLTLPSGAIRENFRTVSQQLETVARLKKRIVTIAKSVRPKRQILATMEWVTISSMIFQKVNPHSQVFEVVDLHMTIGANILKKV